MFSRLRALFGRSEEPPEMELIPFGDLPAWLDAQESQIQSLVAEKFTAPQAEIEIALDQLADLISDFEKEPAGVEDDIMVHPKVKSVLKTALPQTVRSLRQLLDKRPSGEPEAYYAASAEILKGAIATAKGPGKYLAAVYKEETPRLRRFIKDIGRAVNTMTAALGEASKEREKIEKIRTLYRRIDEINRSIGDAEERARSNERSAADLEPKIQAAEDELAALSTTVMKKKIHEAESALEAAIQSYAQVRAPVAAVLRRAERLLKRHKTSTAAVKPLMEICESQNPRPEMVTDIAPALETIRSLIESGELQLKNREEQQLFGEGTIVEAVQASTGAFRLAKERLHTVQEEAKADPVIQAEERLIAELHRMKRVHTESVAAITSAEDEQIRLQEEYAVLGEELQTLLRAYCNCECQLR